MHWLKIASLRIGILLCLAVSPLMLAHAQDTSLQTGDEIADAARKAREEKKTFAKPKKVFTEDDIAPRIPSKDLQPPASTPPAGNQQTVASPADAISEKKSAEPQESDEVKWRKRFKAAHDKLAAAEKQLDILQRDLNKTELQYYPDPQKAMKEQNTREGIKERTAKIDEQKAEVARLKQAINDLEDELRKSGGDTGWARE